MIEIPDVVTDVNLAQLRQFAAKLRFAPLEGRIWLGEHRMVLLHGEAFAALRNELIASLGVDTARGLLTRIGYAAGCRDAELAWKTSRDNATMGDLMGSGSALHGLQGFVKVERLHSVSGRDRPDTELHLEWIWRDSIEDDGHIAAHGVGSYAACWTEVGYSSGYLSTCGGRRILVREVECRALGHAQCRSIAKPVSQWEDAEEDLRFLEPQVAPVKSYGGFATGNAAAVAAVAASAPAAAAPNAGDDPPMAHSAVVASHFSADDETIVGASAAFHVLRHHILRVGPTRATVLLLGESGVGKSLFARDVHRHSLRASKPFVEVNCAAIPEQLIESELFGVERGAFSGAMNSRPGRFETANGGTLFLDEIATLSLTAQGKLLRVLQSGELERLGSNKTLRTDVRIVAATNENLSLAVKECRFRADLFFRLNVFALVVAPLRERRDDIPLLTEALLGRFARRHGRRIAGITSRAMQAILQHPWPGNIRELENVLERGVILANDDELVDLHHLSSFGVDVIGAALSLPAAMSAVQPGPILSSEVPAAGQDVVVEPIADAAVESLDALAFRIVRQGMASMPAMEDALVRAAVQQADGNISRAATLLGVSRAQVDYRHKKLEKTFKDAPAA